MGDRRRGLPGRRDRADHLVEFVRSTSLYKTGISKAGWASLLIAGAATDHIDPIIRAADAQALGTGAVNPTYEAFFAAHVDRTMS